MNVVHIIFLFPIPLTWLFQLEHLYVCDERGFSIGTPIYLNVVHIIFFFPIVTPPLTLFHPIGVSSIGAGGARAPPRFS